MKTLIRAAVVASATLGSVALAHGGGAFKMMDLDGDGKISMQEHEAGAKKMWDAMDGNRDGKVTAVEMNAAKHKMPDKKMKDEKSATEKIATIDTNGDGMLSAEEHAHGSKKMFAMMDTDKDGFLSKGELEAGHAAMLKSK